jgi:outer membrane lipopolysaccharide assembly protein LptE/RlpB
VRESGFSAVARLIHLYLRDLRFFRGWVGGSSIEHRASSIGRLGCRDLCYLFSVKTMPRVLVALLLVVELAGCGYHLVGTTSFLPEDIETLHVENFVNQTKWVDMDQRLMEALTLEWVRRRRLQLVDNPGQADVILSGTIQRLSVIPVSYDEQGRANEYQMSLQAMVQLKDVRPEEAEVLWEDKAFSRRTSYAVDPVAVNYFDRQNIAMTELSSDFASALVTAVLEGF